MPTVSLTPRSRLFRPLVLALSAAALTACGGGGDDAAPPRQPPNANAARVQLSEANAASVVAQALQANAGGVGLIADARGFQDDPAADASSKAGPGAAQKALRSTLRKLQAAKVSALGASTNTTGCGVSGNRTITLTVAADDRPTVGDKKVQVDNKCNETGLVETDGTITDTTTRVEFANGRLSVDHEVVVSGFKASFDDVADHLDGTFVVKTSLDAAVTEFQAAFTSASYIEERTIGGVSHSFHQVSGLDYSARFPADTRQWIQSPTFVSSGSFNGLGDVSFAFSTVEPLVLESDDVAPTAGKFVVTGALGSTATVTLQGFDVVIDVDTNGDGVVDASLNLTTDDLAALL